MSKDPLLDKTSEGAHPSIRVNLQKTLTAEQTVIVLKKLKSRIEDIDMNGHDSTECGNKYTECSWGTCTDDEYLYPDALMHIWPLSFRDESRIAPLELHDSARCPMDRREDGDFNGCFYKCRYFNSRGKIPSREHVLELVDIQIASAESFVKENSNGR